ncbi:hypothetical protein [Neisseria chenwenguii]|uniref:Uncharacterized protein n=1 Tax=Neisseria chenwenguii TaxID=1853278 RepID=A0A220S209_9NEIS|nr:hypothetical protein [Neisseria chenwenguii]ASK27521.1 hypothetical protein BG910_06980 [Neisseria chenwenguii]
MQKNRPQKFRLTPQILIRATFGVCILAIIGVILGVIGTFNSGKKQTETAAPQPPAGSERVEVWKPNGSEGGGAVVLNPDVMNQTDGAQAELLKNEAEQAERNPFLTRQNSGERPRARPMEQQNRAVPNGELQPSMVNTPSETAVPPVLQTEPQPAPQPEPETHQPAPAPQPEPKPAPQAEQPEPKPEQPSKQGQEMDNLF